MSIHITFNTILLSLSLLIFLSEEHLTESESEEEECQVKGIPGKCVPVSSCPVAIGELSSGITPQICSSKNVKGSSEVPSVCCVTKTRVSGEWCQKYKEVLMEPLVLDGNKKGPLTVRCEAFLSPFISGGRDAANREYPHQVALGYVDDKKTISWKCGGTLISEQFVLTAGHCVSRTNMSLPKIVLMGDSVLNQNNSEARQIVDIADVIPNPEYKPPLLYNDIALIKLKSKVKLSRSVLPACLPQPADRLDKILHVTATGWGQLGQYESQSEKLQTVDLTKISLKNCSAYFSTDAALKLRLPVGVIRSQFCAGDFIGNGDTCKGDSGGPIVVNKAEPCVYHVVGITSFGSYCGYQQPGVYTNVQRYLDWIEKVVWDDKYPVSLNQQNDPEHSLVFNGQQTTTTEHPQQTTTSGTQKPIKIKNPILIFTDDRTEPSRTVQSTEPPVGLTSVSHKITDSFNFSSTNSPRDPTLSPTQATTSTEGTTGTTPEVPESTTTSTTSAGLKTAKPSETTFLKHLIKGYENNSIESTLEASEKNIEDLVAHTLLSNHIH